LTAETGVTLPRTSQRNNDYFVWTGGFEYTFTGTLDSVMNFGVVGEWMFDKREPLLPKIMISLVLQLAVNDATNTEALLGWVQDLDTSAQ